MGSVFIRFFILIVILNGSVIFHARADDTTTILLYGDSITAGYGLEAKDSVPVRLEKMLREQGKSVRVVSGGVSGDTTSGGRSRLGWTLKKHEPDIVVLALGGNDVLRGLPPEIPRENLDAMLTELKEQDMVTVLSAVQAPENLGEAYTQAFNAIYPELAAKHEVPLYPFYLERTYGKAELMQADGIHPSAEGARVIAEDLAGYLTGRYPQYF